MAGTEGQRTNCRRVPNLVDAQALRARSSVLHNSRCIPACPNLTTPDHPSKTLKISPFLESNFSTTSYNVR